MASSTNASTDQSAASSSSGNANIRLKIMSPSPEVPPDLAYSVLPSTSIHGLKCMIRDTLESRPTADRQRLIYRGKVLESRLTVRDMLAGVEPQDEYPLHLVLSPAPEMPQQPSSVFERPAIPRPPPQTTATLHPNAFLPPSVQHQGRITATTTRTTTTSIITPRGAGANPFDVTGRPAPTLEQLQQTLRNQAEMLQRLRARRQEDADVLASAAGTSTGVSLPNARNSVSTPTARAQISATSTPTSVSSTAATAGSNSSVGGSPVTPRPRLNLPTAEQTIRRNIEYLENLRRAQAAEAAPRTNDMSARRRALLDSLRELEEEEARVANPQSTSSTEIPTAPQQITFAQHTIPPNSLVYLLQDPMGRPHSLLVGPAGSALQGIPPAAIPGLLFNGQPYQFMTPLVQPQMAAGAAAQPGMPQNNLHIPPAAPNVEALRRELGLNAQGQQPHHFQEIPRILRNRVGFLWLALKLTLFVVLFTGNGGWRRSLYLASIAIVIFIWQTGLFNDVIRPLIEAVFPPPPQQQQQQNARQNPTPESTAQILINRQEDRLREMIRNVERAIMIFMASLVPGWHDRHVNAIEQQQQVVREQQRLQQEERERQQQQQQQQQQQEEEEELMEVML